MVNRETIENYIDGVVAYHQYVADPVLELTKVSARQHPDTLEVFQGIVDAVTDNDAELAVIYCSVLRSRGQKRIDAIDKVRTIETDIAHGLIDCGVIPSSRYGETIKVLADDAEIKQRAEGFVRLFRQFIPAEIVPVVSSSKKRSTTSKPIEKRSDLPTPEVIQDSIFELVLGEGDQVFINDKETPKGRAEEIIFDILIDEVLEGDHFVGPSLVKKSAKWRSLMADLGKGPSESHQMFSRSIQSIKDQLEALGLKAVLVQTGEGRGIGYRLKVDRMRDQRQSTQETAVLHTETAEERTINFAYNVETYITELVNSLSAKETRLSLLARAIGNDLSIDPEIASNVIKSLAGNRFFVTPRDGQNIIVLERPENIVTLQREVNVPAAEKPEHQRIAEIKARYGMDIVRYLSGLDRAQTRYKTAIVEAVPGLALDDVNAVCALLRNDGLLYQKEQAGRSRGHGKKGKTWGVTQQGREIVTEERLAKSRSARKERAKKA